MALKKLHAIPMLWAHSRFASLVCHSFLLSCHHLKLQNRDSQSVEPAHQPDNAGLIGVDIKQSGLFQLRRLLNNALRRTVETLQPPWIHSTAHLNTVVRRRIEYWLCVIHRLLWFCISAFAP